MKLIQPLLPIFLIAGVIWACTPSQHPSNAETPLAFRSVLDQQARMLTIALNDDVWVAYDVQTASLYKNWKGDVLLDGAVYTTQHGPQPTSQGYPYTQKGESDSWILLKDGKELPAQIQYLGHRFKEGKVFINFDLITPEGEHISLSESPAYQSNEKQAGLRRHFSMSNNSAYQVALRTTLSSLEQDTDYQTDGEFTTEHSQTDDYPSGSLSTIRGVLTLGAGETYLSTFYHHNFDKIAEEVAAANREESGDQPRSLGASLIEQSDCRSCHNEEVKTVGPAYLTIARKYNDDEKTVKTLAARIIAGGSGVWGIAHMTPHPDLMEADAENMVSYILSLDDEEDIGFNKYTLGLKSSPLSLEDRYEGEGGKGLMAHLYYNDEGLRALDIEDKLQAVKQGAAPHLHLLSERDFGGRPENFAVAYKGSIEIEREDSYGFRLISDDASYLYIDGELVIDNGGDHGPQIVDGEVYLTAGKHPVKVLFRQGGGGAALSWQWFSKEKETFELVGEDVLSFDKADIDPTTVYTPPVSMVKTSPGDGAAVDGVHPSFDLSQARPDDFEPKVGGIDFLPDGRMLVCTWDAEGAVYMLENWQAENPASIKVKQIASGLAEPLGLKVVNDKIYILQKQELTELIDHNGDDIIDEYRAHSYAWKVSANFHEFAFGLVYQDGYFYATLATAILPGGASAQPQIPDRGKVVKISEADGSVEFVAHGLRTPNGIGIGVDDEIFIADNQGDWLPASKIVHLKEGAFYGSHSVDPIGTKDLPETLPVVWLPQDEIGNSPSTPIYLDKGPYAGQMIHCEVTNGGIKRVAIEKVNGQYQGALFRFSQGLEAGVNRILWAPDGSLMVGGIGSSGNWSHSGGKKFGLQRLSYNEKTTFEMLKVSARSNGFLIEFTEPISPEYEVGAKDFVIQQWYYQPTQEYGGPKLAEENLSVKTFSLSDDRKQLFVELPGMKAGHVVYIKVNKALKSVSGQALWSTEAWYTLNEIPENQTISEFASK
ncbi:MAG: PA14 domain-containing protein [Bacteroidota bacterium]